MPLSSFTVFAKRVIFSALLGLTAVMCVVGTGMIGFHYIEALSWIDSYLQSAMFFGGLGTEYTIQSWWGKFFAATYAIVCPFGLIASVTILLMPFLHRFLHKFHLDERDIVQK